jgi:tetratricopeptide (TPR) repeat protein
VQLSIVRALINKMEITQQFTTEAFTELLSFFKPALTDPALAKELVYQCFRVRSLPFEQNLYWFQVLLSELESALHELATNHPLVYLDWAEAYHYLLYTDTDKIYTGYKATMVAQTVLLLKPLEGYYTEDTDILYRLGKAFADTAQSSPDYELKLVHYKFAFDFFTQSHDRRPQGIWTYPVDAIITLYYMAGAYQELGLHEKVIDTFEQGLQLFSKAPNHATDYTLNQYWGDFLIEYSGRAYKYQSADLNRRAEEKLHLAIKLILEYQSHPYFSRPYFSLAKLAIKSGDKEKCVSLLLQCREAIRAKGFPGYHLQDALEEEDFREVWERLQ